MPIPVSGQPGTPSLDPNRIEVLVLSALDAKTNTQTLEMYACVAQSALRADSEDVSPFFRGQPVARLRYTCLV
jgi:hypothetical protein